MSAQAIDHEDVLATWERTKAASKKNPTVPPMLVPAVLLLAPALIASPILFGADRPPLAYALTVLPFAGAIVALSLWRADWHASRWSLLAAGFVALLILAGFRGAHAGALPVNAARLQAVQFVLLAVLGAFAFLRERRAGQRARYLRALCWSPAVFVAINVVLQVGGFEPADQIAPANLPATMLGLLGVTASRVAFPLTIGVVGIGPIAVAALVISVVFVIRGERRPAAAVGALLSVYVILAIDSRGALMFAAIALALVLLTPRARARGLGWVAIVLPVLPVLLILMLTGLAETDVGSALNRQGGEDISTGTGRTVVWDAVIDTLTKPTADNAWGYGQNGQVTSGASLGYAYLFPGDEDPLSHSAHNVVLQSALELGWIGALLFVVLAAAVVARLARRARDPLYEALTCATLALLLLGLVQSDPSPTHPDSFAFWVLVVFAATRTDAQS